jgi:hypothetical protein
VSLPLPYDLLHAHAPMTAEFRDSIPGMGTVEIRSRDGCGEWWMDHHEVVAFARALVETDQLGSCQHSVIDYFGEPQLWTWAHRMWCATGRPDGPGHPRFDELMKRYATEGNALRNPV